MDLKQGIVVKLEEVEEIYGLNSSSYGEALTNASTVTASLFEEKAADCVHECKKKNKTEKKQAKNSLPTTICNVNKDKYPIVLISQDILHSGATLYNCCFCFQKFDLFSKLKKHLRTHIDEPPCTCQICLKAFTSNFSVKIHMRRWHNKEWPYSTDICSKTFSQLNYLTTHVRSQTAERPFTCETCSKRFSQKGNLKCHMGVHSGERPYTCKTCSKRFSQKGNLKCHMRVHSGERPYTCKTCSKGFSQKGNLKCHMRLHTCERTYSCGKCSKRFSRKYTWNYHMRLHSGEHL